MGKETCGRFSNEVYSAKFTRLPLFFEVGMAREMCGIDSNEVRRGVGRCGVVSAGY